MCGNPKRVANLEMKILIRFLVLSGRSLPGERPEIQLLSRCIVDAVIATGLLRQPQLDHQDYVFLLRSSNAGNSQIGETELPTGLEPMTIARQ